jgi:hypothetical protein
MELAKRRVISREANVVRVDFHREPDPPGPRFPGAGALRIGEHARDLLESAPPRLSAKGRRPFGFTGAHAGGGVLQRSA